MEPTVFFCIGNEESGIGEWIGHRATVGFDTRLVRRNGSDEPAAGHGVNLYPWNVRMPSWSGAAPEGRPAVHQLFVFTSIFTQSRSDANGICSIPQVRGGDT